MQFGSSQSASARWRSVSYEERGGSCSVLGSLCDVRYELKLTAVCSVVRGMVLQLVAAGQDASNGKVWQQPSLKYEVAHYFTQSLCF